MTDLSPAAQAVLDAAEIDFQIVFNDIEAGIAEFRRRTIAAALRAVADQVTPEESTATEEIPESMPEFMFERLVQRQSTRTGLLRIANELDP